MLLGCITSSTYNTIYKFKNKVYSTLLNDNDRLYFSDIKGNFIEFNITSHECKILSIENDVSLWKPIMSSCGHIFIASHGVMYQIEI